MTTEIEAQSAKVKAQGKLQTPSLKRLGKGAVGNSARFLSRRDTMKIARRFNAGCRFPSAQVPKGRLNAPNQPRFGRPVGTRSIWDLNPALKRWAIVDCPSGTGQPRDASDFRAASHS